MKTTLKFLNVDSKDVLCPPRMILALSEKGIRWIDETIYIAIFGWFFPDDPAEALAKINTTQNWYDFDGVIRGDVDKHIEDICWGSTASETVATLDTDIDWED